MGASSLLRDFFTETGETFRFTLRFFREVWIPPYRFKEFLKQCYNLGLKSAPLVGITAFIMGLVVTLQTRPTLIQFGAGSWLPAMASVGIVREIGPVVTALMFAGKVGSNIGAELGSMRVTEQIDAMEVAGINPFRYVAITRILACTIMVPVLVIYADVLSLFGAFLAANIKGHISLNLYFNQVFIKLVYLDVFPALLKSFFFGFTIGTISSYQGYNSKKGTEGVGKSANASVVISSLLIFIIDLLAVQLTAAFMKY